MIPQPAIFFLPLQTHQFHAAPSPGIGLGPPALGPLGAPWNPAPEVLEEDPGTHDLSLQVQIPGSHIHSLYPFQ